MIRLDAMPITGLPQMSKSDIPGSYTVRVNCVLHSGQLSEQQELEVRVNEVLQVGVREGDQYVFTWQFFRASDEVRIALLSKGVRMKYWQACWNEQDAILHAGTLPVHVFFAGKPQPLMDASIPPFSATAQTNGSSLLAGIVNGHAAPLVQEGDQDEHHTGVGGEAPEGNQRTVFVQDLLVIATSGNPLEAQQERDVTSQEVQQEELARGERGEEDEGQWEDGEPDVVETKSDEVLHVDDGEVREEGSRNAPYAEVSDLTGAETQQRLARAHPSTARRLAAFHANPLALQEVLQSLNDLVVTMPPKTLIVDMRPQERLRKRYQNHDGLSKQLLRSVFGAKYWDRGWAIQITSHSVPPTDSVGSATWRYVVNMPDSHPDGIPALAKKLEEGYCIVVIDSIAPYGESRRRAVIEELQQRVSGIVVGPLG